MATSKLGRAFRPKQPFTVPMRLLIPMSKMVQGVLKSYYSEPENSPLFYGAFRTFGGTETTSNDVYTIVNTGIVDTWFRPDIKSNCRIYIVPNEQVYEIISDPENIDMRNKYLQFRVRKVGKN